MSSITFDRAREKAAAGGRSRRALRAGQGLSAFAILFLALDCLGKLLQVEPVMAGTKQLGYPAGSVLGIGVVLLLCLVTYVNPRTSVLGAILLTGFLGGAVATHVRVGNPVFTHILFPIYVAAFVWGGLYMREPRLRALIPWRAGR